MISHDKINVEELKAAASGREIEILRQVAGIDETYLDGKHHPCPKCGGKDRFRLINRDSGAVLCNQCFHHDNGDFIAAVQWMRELSFSDSLKEISDYIGFKSDGQGSKISEPAAEKRTEYLYRDELGGTPYKVLRIDRADNKKSFVQYRMENGVWQKGLNGRSFIPIPYRLPDLLHESIKTVYIVEGEKCADALANILCADNQEELYAATTISGGSNSWKRLGAFADRFYGLNVVLLSDNDIPGRKAALEGLEKLSSADGLESLTLVEFGKDSHGEEAMPSYDIADWIDEMRDEGYSDSEILTAFFRYVQTNGRRMSAELVQSLGGQIRGDSVSQPFEEPKNEPFPIETFPKLVRDYCVAAAISTNVDVSFTGLASMTALSAVIGRRYALDYRDWSPIRPIINGVCIGTSGMGKSPAIHRAIFPLGEAQDYINEEEQRDQKRVDRMNKGLKPKDREMYRLFPKVLLTDTTTESLYADLHDGEALHVQHGLLGYYDEIALLFNSMDAYKSGSADLSRFLSITDGSRLECGRKTGMRKISASKPHFPIIGGIQPSSLVGILKDKPELIDRGFIHRFFFSFPEPIKKQVSPPTVAVDLQNEYRALFRLLLNQSLDGGQASGNLSLLPYDLPKDYEMDGDSTEPFEAIRVTLSKEANDAVDAFVGKTFDEENSLPEVLISYWMKSWIFLLRIALLFHIVKITTGECEGRVINRKTMDDAIVLMHWFRREFVKLISAIPREGHNAPSLIEQTIVDRIVERAEGLTKRDIKRMFSRFNKAGGTEELEKHLNKLCAEKRIARQLVHANGKSKEIYLAP